jgi:hypothetical protein
MDDMTTHASATAHTVDTPQLRLIGDGRRQRSPVLAAQPRTRAIQLVGAGQTYQLVADELGCAWKVSRDKHWPTWTSQLQRRALQKSAGSQSASEPVARLLPVVR